VFVCGAGAVVVAVLAVRVVNGWGAGVVCAHVNPPFWVLKNGYRWGNR